MIAYYSTHMTSIEYLIIENNASILILVNNLTKKIAKKQRQIVQNNFDDDLTSSFTLNFHKMYSISLYALRTFSNILTFFVHMSYGQ